ncbi:MAG: hypothetical protein PWP56_2582 [Acetobacterium sp.]|nr:hypothetical protein [Acetobacterium sp.]
MAYTITERCIGCQLCAKNCPVMAITGEKKQQHQINDKRCLECGVCQKGCPKNAILNEKGQFGERIPKSEWEKPVVNEKLCSACGICADICIFNAIKISYPRFKGDLKVYAQLENPNNCVGCRQCEINCPLGAIEMEVVQ